MIFKVKCSAARYFINGIITKEQFLRDCAYCGTCHKHCQERDKALSAVAQYHMAGV